MRSVKLRFVDKDQTFIYAARNLFPEAEFFCGDLASAPLSGEAFATAGNSFGIMDGGIDLAVAQLWPGVQGRVRLAIERKYCGFLPVGTAITVKADKFTTLIYAPTMTVPEPVRNTLNAYLAMLATLNEARKLGGMPLNVCGFATTTGRLYGVEAALQMRLAYDHFLSGSPQDWEAVGFRVKEWRKLIQAQMRQTAAIVAGDSGLRPGEPGKEEQNASGTAG